MLARLNSIATRFSCRWFPGDAHFIAPQNGHGSPAIDFGTNTGCPSTDQPGAHRPIGTTCDVGAVEVGYLFLPLILR
jgi:hypothetical protein